MPKGMLELSKNIPKFKNQKKKMVLLLPIDFIIGRPRAARHIETNRRKNTISADKTRSRLGKKIRVRDSLIPTRSIT